MPVIKGYVVRDNYNNIYLETIRTTRSRSIDVFLKKVNLGDAKNKWHHFYDNGYACLKVTCKIDTRGHVSRKNPYEIKPKENLSLRLPLLENFFNMTLAGVKTEDYRKINSYWLKRLFDNIDDSQSDQIIKKLNNGWPIDRIEKKYKCSLKVYKTNTITMGFPRKEDLDKIKVFEHAGVAVKKGKVAWGAEPDKLYFVIKHGALLQ